MRYHSYYSVAYAMLTALATASVQLPNVPKPLASVTSPAPGFPTPPGVLDNKSFSNIAEAVKGAASDIGVHSRDISANVDNFSVLPDPKDPSVSAGGGANTSGSMTIKVNDSIGKIAGTLYTLAYRIEANLCRVISSLTAENMSQASASLAGSVQAEAQTLLALGKTIDGLATSLKNASSKFTDSEKMAIQSTVAALSHSAGLAVEPLGAFNSALQSGATTAFSASLADLANSFETLMKATATANFSP